MKLKRLEAVISRLYHIPMEILHKKFSRIIMFHSVSPTLTNDSPSCYCSLDEFQQILDYIVVAGYQFASLDECLDAISDRCYTGKCVISFDDAKDNFYRYAYPVLKARNYPFILYVPSRQLGMDGIMSREEVAKVATNHLCTIGSHTRNHVNCAQCENLAEEIFGSKQDLEALTGREIKHFAYPWGSLDDVSYRSIRMLKKAGYVSAVGTLPAALHGISTMSRYYLPRINANAYLPLLSK